MYVRSDKYFFAENEKYETRQMKLWCDIKI